MAESSLPSCSYKLSRELKGHTDEVRSLAIFKDGSIVSTSRDKTAIYWRSTNGDYASEPPKIMKGHTDFVCSVAVIEPTIKNPTGFIITGSTDKNICIYYPGEEQPIHTITAHENMVCGLRASVFENESFLSSSSDHTGKLWNLYDLKEPKAIFSGHALLAIVWCIADLPNGFVVTGASDKTVIVYSRDGKILHKLSGHLDCVRDIAIISDCEFLTCGNDAVTKLWNAESGICLGTYSEHKGHIYSISSVLGGSLAVSCGEDRTLKVWHNGKVDQTIIIPSETAWSVKLLPDKDIVCGSSDGIVRIFTTNTQKYIDDEAMAKFEHAVNDCIKKFKKQDKRNKANDNSICHASELNQPGEKDGDTMIVKEGGMVKAYRWSKRDFQWNLVGDVRKSDKLSTDGKQMYNGVQYDHVFSVDIEEGAPLLKIPYNNGQNPYVVAQQFIKDNDLDYSYLEQVANFIMTNLQLEPVLNAESQYSDAFAGCSKYVPASKLQDTTLASMSTSKSTYIPQKNYLKFEQGNISAIYEKLKELNANSENEALKIPDDKLETVIKLATITNSDTIEEGISNLKALLNWPNHKVFPVLDIARLAVLNKDVNKEFSTNETLDIVKRHFKTESTLTNQMLSFRLLANLFCHKTGQQFCVQCKDEILTIISNFSQFGNKHNEVAVSTYMLNLVIALKEMDNSSKKQTLEIILRLVNILKETEALFRLFVGLGTLILRASNSDECNELINCVKQSEVVLQTLKKLSTEVESSDVPNKLIGVSKQILEILA